MDENEKEIPELLPLPEDHLPGRRVSATTYRTHGCRCSQCRAAATRQQAIDRKKPGSRAEMHMRATSRATAQASKWVRTEHPEIWTEIYRTVMAKLEQEKDAKSL